MPVPEGAWRNPGIAGQAVPGVQVARAGSAAQVRKHGKARVDTAPARRRDARGSAPSRRNGEVLSTVAARAGGPARSSGEARVMRAEGRGRPIWTCLRERPGRKPWEETSEHVRARRAAG